MKLNIRRPSSIVDRRSSAAAVLVAALYASASGVVWGQTRGAIVPSIDVMTLHDDNVFVTPHAAKADHIVRVSPALTAERHFPRGRYSGSYTVDAERYAHHDELTSPLARAQAFTRMQYTAGQRLLLTADHGYVNTTAPTELNIATALATSRMRTSRTSAGASATYRVSRRTTGTASYSMTGDRLEDGRAMRTSMARASIGRTLSKRERLQIEYERTDFHAVTHSTGADAVRLGWTRAIGGNTHLQLRGGPRITAGSPSVDFLAHVTDAREHTTMSVSFEQTQTTVIGLAVPVDAQSLQMHGRWTWSRALSVGAAPGVFRSRFADRTIDMMRITADTRYAINKTVAIEAMLTAERQRGVVELTDAGTTTLRRRTLSIGLRQQWK